MNEQELIMSLKAEGYVEAGAYDGMPNEIDEEHTHEFDTKLVILSGTIHIKTLLQIRGRRKDSMTTLYNVISEDWFIAYKDGSEDFIPDELWPYTLDIYKQFEVLVMGRRTYETIQTYPASFYKPLEALSLVKAVVSHDPEFKAKPGYQVLTSPEEAIVLRHKTLVSTGPTLNNYLLKNGLIDKVILHQVPTATAEGIPVFDAQYKNILTLESESDARYAKLLTYKVRKKI